MRGKLLLILSLNFNKGGFEVGAWVFSYRIEFQADRVGCWDWHLRGEDEITREVLISMSESQPVNIPELKVQAQAAVQAAEEAWRSHVPARLIAALHECDRMLQALPEERVDESTGAPDGADECAQERWALWLWRGRLLVMADQPDVVVKGLHSLDQAIARLQRSGDGADIGAALAVAWMNRGSGLFRLGANDAVSEAVHSYEQAIAVLGQLAGADNNTLGAAWMNRGVGLMRLQDVTETPEAKTARLAGADESFANAIKHLEPLAASQPAALRNLASAWANLGLLRAQRGEVAPALEAHRQAVALFRPLVPAGLSPAVFELAARLYNLSQAAGVAGDTAGALASGREALELATKVAAMDPQAGELALRSRHAVCVILGGLLAAGGKDAPERAARLSEAGDLVEEGLAALTARGAAAGDGEKQAGARLYEFGAWLYRTQQPHFLGEYLLEHLGEDPVRAKIAAAAVQAARQALVQRNFNDTTHGDMDRVLDVLQELGLVETRLRELGVPV